MRNLNLFGIMVVGVVLTTNINSARADYSCQADGGTCFDSDTQTCTKAFQVDKCPGRSSTICCPAGGQVKQKCAEGQGGKCGAGSNVKIELVFADGDRADEGNIVHVAWDRNLAEKPVRVGFKTTPVGQVVRVAEGGRDPMMFGTLVNDDQWLVLDEGDHGALNACVTLNGQCSSSSTFGPYKVKRDEAPRQAKLVHPGIAASQMQLAPLRTADPTATQLQEAVDGNGEQLNRIEGGVDDLRHGPSAVAMRVLAATAGGAVIGAVLGAAFSDTTLGGASTGGALGAGAGLAVGALWAIQW